MSHHWTRVHPVFEGEREACAQGVSRLPCQENTLRSVCESCPARHIRDCGDNAGEPPCRRCQEEGHECVLVASRRGGRRVRKRTQSTFNSTASNLGQSPRRTNGDHGSPRSPRNNHHRASMNPSLGTLDDRLHVDWTTSTDNNWDGVERQDIDDPTTTDGSNKDQNLENHIASADLLNPSDALGLLAQVASHDDEGVAGGTPSNNLSNTPHSNHNSAHEEPIDFTPISSGILSESNATMLVHDYQQKYHSYFPIVPKDIFNTRDVLYWIQMEPYIMAAVFTVASHNHPNLSEVHAACSAYMERLVSGLIYTGSSSVGAVEALLILAEWAPQRLENKSSIGRGEEDHGAWMQVGCAIRLGYLQNLEQTGLLLGKAASSDPDTQRKRLAWAACYMSDRQVSIRVGKGFWSRGPGPTTVISPTNLPTLEGMQGGYDNLSLLFQANMELTQLYSNAHDILYSSTSHREHLYLGGEYVRYIDDFAATLRKWQLMWGALSCTPHVKATLMLSYDFLRLYINAFAFQATISRVVARARQLSPGNFNSRSVFSDIAGSPDARFIYESIDAANSLLGTLNSFIDPVTGLRYMPLRYYLYVIHAAVFLFKARAAGALRPEADKIVRRAVDVTISRFQKSAVHPHSPGYRYAKLLYLLWHKPPRKAGNKEAATDAAGQRDTHQGLNFPEQNRGVVTPVAFGSLDQFSWRDLGSVGQFIASDGSIPDNNFASPGFDLDSVGVGVNIAETGDWLDPLLSVTDLVF
ncbi:hypothetical protein jhhlp_008862 [Lomentospora prolificans]|uniref:Transcription factor domain-containing protein n=1 Tax=Lomentospora prolificans TaxID=41688 RepID=A0A2N3MZ71_9PEZI|nr:hypothetical protein jhhlp_008862 [Lomentospora prolificans]